MANDARLAGSVVPEVRASFHAHVHITSFRFMSFALASPRCVQSSLFYILPQYWQWPGDVEALVVDLTHRVCVHASIFSSSPVTFCRSFFVEIFNFDPTAPNSPHFLSPKAEYPAEFRISACVRAVNNYAII